MSTDIKTSLMESSSLVESGSDRQTTTTISTTAFIDFITSDLDPPTTGRIKTSIIVVAVIISSSESTATASSSSLVMSGSQTTKTTIQTSVRPVSTSAPEPNMPMSTTSAAPTTASSIYSTSAVVTIFSASVTHTLVTTTNPPIAASTATPRPSTPSLSSAAKISIGVTVFSLFTCIVLVAKFYVHRLKCHTTILALENIGEKSDGRFPEHISSLSEVRVWHQLHGSAETIVSTERLVVIPDRNTDGRHELEGARKDLCQELDGS